MKSPAKLKDELKNAVSNIQAIQKYLKNKSTETIAGVGAECFKTSELLDGIIKNNQLPDSYKVAVVGRFKAGKSSFVNELLESKLAGEDTSPETAAVTTFTYGKKIEAKINLIDKASWEEQKKLFNVDPKNIDAHRAKMWDSFKKPKKNADGVDEKFDLAEIEKSLVYSGTNELVISYDESAKGAEKIFRDKLKTYTSGSKPYHCLISSINITTPSALLNGGIELVDTPGLDDTERFRVSLTEESVQHVDAILFLTKSGVAYGQSEKDFLLSLLRKGTIKQLMIVITQVDQTYEQHVKAAQSDEEEPETITQRIAMERRRIKDEIRKTLEELSGSDTVSTRAYSEQFSNVDIVFTSVMAHRDYKAKRQPSVVIVQDDPGGLIGFKNSLNSILSTESRTAVAAGSILHQSKAALMELAESLDGKVSAIRNTKNRDEVERRLNNFRTKFKDICQGVEAELKETYKTFKDSSELRLNQQKSIIENIVLKAGKELSKFRTIDVGRHWRTRRNANWGYMHELQSRVANRIFPTVQEMLESHIEDFSTYIKRHERKISKLTKDAVTTAGELELGEFTNFDIKKRLKESTNKILEKTQEQIISEQEQIIKLLDSFVTVEVESKISEKRKAVADIWGAGTTYAQQSEVNTFYDSIEEILSEALTAHVSKRNYTFAQNLLKSAEHAPKETFQEIDFQLESTIENLRQATEMAINGQKEQAEKLLTDISTKALKTIVGFEDLMFSLHSNPTPGKDEDLSISTVEPPQAIQIEESQVGTDWADKILNESKKLFQTFSLKDGESGWPFSKIFDQKIFLAANKIRVVEPYLFKFHQLRNLEELLLFIVENSKPKSIVIFTLPPPIERQDYNEKFFDSLSKELFNNHGITLEIEISTGLHDRYVFSDAGYVAKLGRGLDIYKPSTGLASHRQESRRVRACEINIFTSL
jgi:GTPase Era involved in 16S rRNA processing